MLFVFYLICVALFACSLMSLYPFKSSLLNLEPMGPSSKARTALSEVSTLGQQVRLQYKILGSNEIVRL